MSHLLIKYFEDLNPSLHNIKYLCDEIINGSFDCGRNSYENTNFRAKLELFRHRDSKSNNTLTNNVMKMNEDIQSLSEMLNAANKAKQLVNSLKH